MNATMITYLGCGAEIPPSEALKEQFRHENQARLQAIAEQAKQKARMPPPKARARRWNSSTIISPATSSAAASKRRSRPSRRWQRGLDGERRAMERIWKEREKQIDRVLANTAGMYGEVRGILGSSVPPVPAIELDAIAARLEGPDFSGLPGEGRDPYRP